MAGLGQAVFWGWEGDQDSTLDKAVTGCQVWVSDMASLVLTPCKAGHVMSIL